MSSQVTNKERNTKLWFKLQVNLPQVQLHTPSSLAMFLLKDETIIYV